MANAERWKFNEESQFIHEDDWGGLALFEVLVATSGRQAWHGAYSAFSRFREELARAAGYPIVEYRPGAHEVVLDWDRFEDKNYAGEWDSVPDDPLIILLVHADNSGRIPAEFCAHLANRVEALIPLLPEVGAGHMSAPREKAAKFVEGLRFAAEEGEDVGFY